MGVLTYARQGQIASARADLAIVEQRADRVGRQVDLIRPLEQQMSGLLIKKRIDSELGSGTDCSAVLAELCRLTPTNMALTSLDLQTVEVAASELGGASGSTVGSRAAVRNRPTRGAAGTGRGVRRVKLDLTGLAPTDVDVANFIGQLSASPLFVDVRMGYSRSVSYRGRTAREFQATCHLAR